MMVEAQTHIYLIIEVCNLHDQDRVFPLYIHSDWAVLVPEPYDDLAALRPQESPRFEQSLPPQFTNFGDKIPGLDWISVWFV